MSFIDGAAGVVKLDNVSGVLTDYSASIMSATLNINGNAQPFYTLGSKYANAPDSKKSWSVDLVFYAETGSTGAYGMITDWLMNNDIPGAKTLLIGTPDATTTGSQTFTGEVKCDSISPAASIDASGGRPQQLTARLMGDGALTKATVA